MSVIQYRPAEVLHWFNEEAKSTKDEAKKKGKSILKGGRDASIVDNLKQAANVAVSYGKGTFGEIVHRQAAETGYVLFDSGFEANDLVMNRKIDYSAVRQIVSKSGDKFQVFFEGGSITIRPVAHLVAGRLKVPIGWVRNGMEVPYMMLIEEISARSGVEIDSE